MRDIAPVASISRNPFVMEVNPIQRPIRAKSISRRPGMVARPISPASCSR
jgi:hypothetical protein